MAHLAPKTVFATENKALNAPTFHIPSHGWKANSDECRSLGQETSQTQLKKQPLELPPRVITIGYSKYSSVYLSQKQQLFNILAISGQFTQRLNTFASQIRTLKLDAISPTCQLSFTLTSRWK